jgi:hypothetical protein
VRLFATGKISREALWRFLAGQEKKLEPEVIRLLKETKCVARVQGAAGELFKPAQVYLPSPPLLALASEIAVLQLDEPSLLPLFTHELGLQTSPSNQVLRNVAAKKSSPTPARCVCLMCFLIYGYNGIVGRQSQPGENLLTGRNHKVISWCFGEEVVRKIHICY